MPFGELNGMHGVSREHAFQADNQLATFGSTGKVDAVEFHMSSLACVWVFIFPMLICDVLI